ncbi:MerR family DNA-binding protein [Streptomyces sp. NPDC059385]|uniref:MerR family DNA-binding protein n=1 Tax=Streptomyces sp. NPDC059385 TaxID=3346817 RepID=UPI0036A4D63E
MASQAASRPETAETPPSRPVRLSSGGGHAKALPEFLDGRRSADPAVRAAVEPTGRTGFGTRIGERAPGGYRDYPARVDFIRSDQAAGLNLADISDVLVIRDGGRPPYAHVTALLDRHLADVERRIAQLNAIPAVLREAARTASATDPATCGESDICRILATSRQGPSAQCPTVPA